MIYQGLPLTFNLIQLGELQRAEAENAAGLANQTQHAFRFHFHPRRFSLGSRYRLPNSGFDLDAAIEAHLARHKLPRPLIFITSAPYSQWSYRRRTDHFFFADLELNDPS